jgi:hypothetical protein
MMGRGIFLLLVLASLQMPAVAAPMDGIMRALSAREQRLQRNVDLCTRGVAHAEQTLRDAESALRLSLSSKDRAAEAMAREAVAVSRENYDGYRELCAESAQDLQRARKSVALARRLLERNAGQHVDAAVVEQRGQVERGNADGGWAPLAGDSAAPLRSGDRLRTGPGSGAEFLLQNGDTAAQIAADSELELTLDDLGNAVVDLSRGAFFAAVTPLKSRMKRMEVRTPAAVIAVRGTRFAVARMADGGTELLVLEGKVEAARLDGSAAVMVHEGQRLVLRPGARAAAVTDIDWGVTRRWWREDMGE